MPKRVSNPPNRFSIEHLEHEDGEAPWAALELYEEDAKSILSENDSPDLGFRWSLNPYRGCQHGCSYCYARQTHEYWGFGAGTDFERRIVVKRNAPELLRAELDARRWKGELIVFSGNTDCYQPVEGALRLTRRCLEVCLEYKNPVGIITKGVLVERDLDVLARLAREAQARVFVSIAFADDDVARAMEPGAPSPSRRFDVLSKLSDAGITTGVSLAPIIPGLNDAVVPEVLERARAAGASRAFLSLVRLPRTVLPVFEERLSDSFPTRAAKIRAAIREVRGGKPNDSRFGERMVGEGPRWKLVEDVFATQCARLGITTTDASPPPPTTFRRPTPQLELWDRA